MDDADKTRDTFTLGYLTACQNLVMGFDQPSMAVDLMHESGIGADEFLKAQKLSGYETRRMNKIIRELSR